MALARITNRQGFTLVELLVVITIIVVLLALLVPAMDKAIYHALLVNCGANQKMVTGTVTRYAFENKRFYPRRPDVPTTGYDGPFGLVAVSQSAVVLPETSVATGYDIRPMIRNLLSLKVNAVTQCPLVEAIDMDARPSDEYVYGNQAIWFGWQYMVPKYVLPRANTTNYQVANGGSFLKGMHKFGDRFVWISPDGRQHKYSLLLSDTDRDRPSPNGTTTSHPDQYDGKSYNAVLVRQSINGAFPHTASTWAEPNSQRGPVDHNFAYDDGSVRRVDRMTRHDDRMDGVSAHYNNANDATQVPRE